MPQSKISMPEHSLPVMESFYTIQGEGYNQGKSAYFIRLGGCDVGCVWCDVKESWPAEAHPMRSIDSLVAAAIASGAKQVVITGGEPSLYNLTALSDALRQGGMQVWIETAGTNPLLGNFDWVCISPKKFKAVLPDNLPLAHELKVVIYHKSDLEWAEAHRSQVGPACKLYLQPEWSKAEEMLPLVIDYVKLHTEWSISLQTHKYMNIP
jgi:organic radical activating enzyme